MEAAIFDEDFAGVAAADYDSGEVNTLCVAFERFRVQVGLAGVFVEAHAQLSMKAKSG